MVTMKKVFHKKRRITNRTALVFVAFLLSGVLFATGALAADGCRSYHHSGIRSLDGNSALCKTCCNSRASQGQCQDQCARPLDSPKVALFFNGWGYSDSLGMEANPVKCFQGPKPGSVSHVKAIESRYKAPPIFLKNESFLI